MKPEPDLTVLRLFVQQQIQRGVSGEQLWNALKKEGGWLDEELQEVFGGVPVTGVGTQSASPVTSPQASVGPSNNVSTPVMQQTYQPSSSPVFTPPSTFPQEPASQTRATSPVSGGFQQNPVSGVEGVGATSVNKQSAGAGSKKVLMLVVIISAILLGGGAAFLYATYTGLFL